ncbi:MAG: hypothetical protein F4Y08_04465 [Caldilineaceae bacterium SB0662_bin_9]|uniref:Uncharacterized protein n=1 Tax=Caldilineaceae bacterium SB0662_bin_9 TaxID=2605258 RepID=A0A6B1DSC1_9CHLR|nr:hypothetical protein [Caldilineaceae bacterium SB0662_bin_9]
METEQREYLHTLYQGHGSLVYASVCAQLAKPVHTAGPWHVYIASKHIGKSEIVYGSLLHIMDEAVRPLFRVRQILQELGNALPDDLRSSVEISVVDGNVTHTLPEGPHTDVLLHKQEQTLKDALLLSAIHVRTLLEDFDGVGNIRIAIYDYEGRPAGDVLLSKVFHTLAHYRYCMVSGEFVHDIFSREGQLGDSNLTGTKMKVEDLFKAVFEFISEIRIRRFVGVLRARLHSLSADSEPSDIIFATQNLQSVWQVIRDRIEEAIPPPGFLSYILNRFVTEKLNAEAPEWATKANVQLAWNRFTFRVADDLGQQLVEVRFGVGENTEMLKLTWDEFFTELVRFHGDEPVVSYETLDKRFKALSDPMLPPPASP